MVGITSTHEDDVLLECPGGSSQGLLSLSYWDSPTCHCPSTLHSVCGNKVLVMHPKNIQYKMMVGWGKHPKTSALGTATLQPCSCPLLVTSLSIWAMLCFVLLLGEWLLLKLTWLKTNQTKKSIFCVFFFLVENVHQSIQTRRSRWKSHVYHQRFFSVA